MDQGHVDIVRCEFPDPEPVRGARVLGTVSAVVVEPLRRDLRLLVYPIAVAMAIGIGVLGHVLGRSDGPSISPPATVAPSAQTVEAGRGASADGITNAQPSDDDPAVPSPRMR
jgi:hypothetical protein